MEVIQEELADLHVAQAQAQQAQAQQASAAAQYVAQLTTQERVTYDIAVRLLGTSFCLEQSIGFLDWKRQNKK